MSTATSSPPALVASAAAAGGVRLASLDVLRGLDILVMMFVNDVAGVTGAPAWMKHIQPPNADGMTFVDVVFPAFLFIVGMAIPLALHRRMQRDPTRAVVRHVLARAFALLVIGVFMVNSPSPEGVLPRAVWSLLMYAGVVLTWVSLPERAAASPRARTAVRAAGMAVLVAAALLFGGRGEPGLIELRTSWWGILGLIGWAYLVASLVYLAARGRLALLSAGVIVLYGLFFADAFGWLPHVPLLAVGSQLGSHGALVLSGALAGEVLRRSGRAGRSHAARIWLAGAYGALMALAAVLLHAAHDLHPAFIINKIAATPAWCLWSAAITIWLWAAIYWVLDARGGRWRVRLLEDAGQNALLAYILAPIAYALFALVPGGNGYWTLGGTLAPGLARAVLFAVLITWAAAALRRKGVLLKL
ncbi:MAG: DUF5009 domain-containing protein [Gemmatimonadetes bacterium]|nr:DUF5009 domain-containing protein [Gemmatimonadota bacterium]